MILIKNGNLEIDGDMYWKNIIITNYEEVRSYVHEVYHKFDIKIIDFGTSYFTGKEISIKRSFDVLM